PIQPHNRLAARSETAIVSLRAVSEQYNKPVGLASLLALWGDGFGLTVAASTACTFGFAEETAQHPRGGDHDNAERNPGLPFSVHELQ
ncbi:MAG: hypothetical protein QF497_11920, partial [Verrucomicrobiota bacterium]|nr:hypothetical protein [Verrucomicrobiota bacterium]